MAVRYDKVTLCLMSDNSVSERHYSKYGGLTAQKVHPPKTNIDDALQYLTQLTEKYKSEHYTEAGEAFKPKKSKAVSQLQMLGKRKAEQKLDKTTKDDEEVKERKRDKKAEEKAAEPVP